MILHAEQLEKTATTKDALKKALVPALRDLMQSKHRAQLAVDELVDSVADLEGRGATKSPAEQRLALESIAVGLEKKGLMRRAATAWLAAYDAAETMADRERCAQRRARCLKRDSVGTREGWYLAGCFKGEL